MCVCGDACGVHPRTLDGLWITRAHLNVTRVDALFVATYKGTESSTIVQFRSEESEKKLQVYLFIHMQPAQLGQELWRRHIRMGLYTQAQTQNMK